jgi:hypothetical protein
VLSTIAANHTKALVADDHGLTSSLISGYQLAFLAGASDDRRRDRPRGPCCSGLPRARSGDSPPAPAGRADAPATPDLDMEREAA